MKSKILLLAVTAAIFLSSCTTSYKTGQTPDDVYFSPTRPQSEYVKVEKEEEREYRVNSDSYYEDQYLRMKVRNRSRWSDLDDPFYYSRRYNYSTYNCCCLGNPWTPSSYWNNHYNPYYNSYIIVNPKTNTAYSRPRTFNLNSYNSNALSNRNYTTPGTKGSGSNGNNTYTAPRNRSGNETKSNAGNILREVFRGNDNNSSGNSSHGNSSTNSSSSSSSSSSGSSSPAPVRKF